MNRDRNKTDATPTLYVSADKIIVDAHPETHDVAGNVNIDNTATISANGLQASAQCRAENWYDGNGNIHNSSGQCRIVGHARKREAVNSTTPSCP